jgi:hypothetical protein
MNDHEKLSLVRKALGFDSGLDAHDNLIGAAQDIDENEQHVADGACRSTIDRVVRQLREAREILLSR